MWPNAAGRLSGGVWRASILWWAVGVPRPRQFLHVLALAIIVIEFLCPNGHRVHCGDEQGGRAAKCPQCGVKFRIPELADVQAAEATPPETNSNPPNDDEQQAEVAISVAQPADDNSQIEEGPQIEFLCPSGHRLHGPATSQGRPGECPECGQRFYIPSFNDVPEDVDTQQELSVSHPAQAETVEPASCQAVGAHPLCELVSKLWTQRPAGASVEVHLSNGQAFIPDRFARDLSQHQYGMFAIKEPGGTHTLTLISWDSIVRVEVRGVESLPKEMSD